MWTYIKDNSSSDPKKKEYTSFPEPNGKPEMPGFTFFENDASGSSM